MAGRHPKQTLFATADGRAHFLLPPADVSRTALASHEYMLSRVRSEGQFNTIVYTDNDTYRRQSERHL